MREKEYLRKRYRGMLSSIGLVLALAGIVMLSPLLLLPLYPGEVPESIAFLFPAACLLLSGALLWRRFRTPEILSLSFQEGGVIVVASWLLVVFASAWPFVLSSDLAFSRAFFESMSGWTTTGLSILDVTRASHLVLFWRSVMQLAGGAGLAIIMVSAVIGPVGVGISSAEGRGDQLVPQVRRSARLVLGIYLSYAAVGTVAYRLAGMSFFDAVNHAFAAVSTGGFSTRAESIGYWNSPTIEAITIPLMLLGNLSFVTAWYLWHGKLLPVARNGEVKLLSVLVPVSVAAVFMITCRGLYLQAGKALRVAIFEMVTVVTTTGFSTVGYGDWNAFGILLLIVLMLVGGGTCSTAGGIKQFRVHLLGKTVFWEVRRFLMPRKAVVPCAAWEGDHVVFVSDEKVRQVAAFVFLYLAVFLLGALILCASGFGFRESLFEFASALGTVGLSVGVTSAGMPDMALWAEILAMFLGRLEIMVVLVSVFKLGIDGLVLMGKEKAARR